VFSSSCSVDSCAAGATRRCCNEDSALTVSASCCPACKDGSESLAHLLFVCPMYDEYRKEMFDGIKTVDGCAAKLSSMLNNADSLQKALSFVACGTWGDTSIEIASYIAAYLQKAWRLRNRCKHVGVTCACCFTYACRLCLFMLVLLCMLCMLIHAERRGADGNGALASWVCRLRSAAGATTAAHHCMTW